MENTCVAQRGDWVLLLAAWNRGRREWARTPPARESRMQAFWCPLRNQILQWLGREDEQVGHRGFGDNEASLCDPVMVGTCHYTCAWTHRVPNTKGDPEVHRALGDDNCPSPGDADGGARAHGGVGGARAVLSGYLAASLTLL